MIGALSSHTFLLVLQYLTADVYIGSGDKQVQCDVIEGACSVECGGPKTLICDTQEWPEDMDTGSSSAWLDVTVYVEVLSDMGPAVKTLTLTNAFQYHQRGYNAFVPTITTVSPRAASAEEVIRRRRMIRCCCRC